MSIIIKDSNIYAVRVSTYRNVEDWRQQVRGNPSGPWAVHCMEHNQRTFVQRYSTAKEQAEWPQSCPTCQAFDLRCIYCPSDIERWKQDPKTGFTASAGQIHGHAVCFHHKYGQIPEGVDYLEVMNVVLNKPLVQVLLGSAFVGETVATVSFQSEDAAFCLKLELASTQMTQKSANQFHEALGFAVRVASILNASLNAGAEQGFSAGFQPWEPT